MPRSCTAPMLIVVVGLAAPVTLAQTVDPFYAANYSIVDLGSVPGVPPSYGGVTFPSGAPTALLIGGAANGGSGAIYRINLVRDGSNNITGFSGSATQVASAPNIDGGLDRGPLGILFYTGYPINTIGQIKPGSTGPDKVISLTPLNIAGSVGSLAIVPGGFPGAGLIKIASYNTGFWYSAGLTPDGTGTYDLFNVGPAINIGGGPEGIVYIPTTSPQFATPSILVSEYATGNVVSYNVDSNGDPIVSTRRIFISGLSGAEGATLDPLTGQFIFSTFGGGNRVLVVRGFRTAPPCYANCDGSTELPVLAAPDFACFAQRFIQAQSLPSGQQTAAYPNCDGSTIFPVLNSLDFACYLSRYRAGCP